jgi:hypothetical protein
MKTYHGKRKQMENADNKRSIEMQKQVVQECQGNVEDARDALEEAQEELATAENELEELEEQLEDEQFADEQLELLDTTE